MTIEEYMKHEREIYSSFYQKQISAREYCERIRKLDEMRTEENHKKESVS